MATSIIKVQYIIENRKILFGIDTWGEQMYLMKMGYKETTFIKCILYIETLKK